MSSDKESVDRGQSAQLQSISEQGAHAPHGSGRENANTHQQTLENGHSTMAGHDSEQYETLTFHVGGASLLKSLLTQAIDRHCYAFLTSE